MTTLLSLDTATESCSVALLHKGQTSYLEEQTPRTHTQRILPMVDQILSEAGISLQQVDAIVFGCGPGSFTGVRIGVGITQGLAFGADLPVIPISNLTAMAQAAYAELQFENVLSAIDARMGEVYFSQVQRVGEQENFSWQHIVPEQVIHPDKVFELIQTQPNMTCVGTGWQAYPQLQVIRDSYPTNNITLPSARHMLPLGLIQWQQQKYLDASQIEPTYLRNEVAWKKINES